MQLTPFQLAVISSGFSLLGVLFGSVLTYWCAVKLAKRNGRRDAGRRLREAFMPELAALDPVTGSKTDVESVLRDAWPRHHAAVSELMFHLSPSKRVALEAAWRQYYEVGGSIRFFDYHFGNSPQDKFKERVGAILKFTET
jgi:hypothetical protein